MKHFRNSVFAAGLAAAALGGAAQAQEPFISEVRMFGTNFCPRGWAEANGQLLAINQYTALFSLLGTNYGGDGRTSFGLPDLRGAVPMHVGRSGDRVDLRQGQTLSAEFSGESGGAAADEPSVTVYQHCNYRGYSVSLTPGDYRVEDLIALGARDNDLSAVRVSGGASVTLYEGPGISGGTYQTDTDVSCLVGEGFNDRTSSIRVEAGTGEASSSAPGPETALVGMRYCIALQGLFPPRN